MIAQNIPAPSKMFPQWTRAEQDFWLDMFADFSAILLEQNPEEDEKRWQQPEAFEQNQEYFTSKIKIAARLADEATLEMIYRFERQATSPRRPRRDDRDGGRKVPTRR